MAEGKEAIENGEQSLNSSHQDMPVAVVSFLILTNELYSRR